MHFSGYRDSSHCASERGGIVQTNPFADNITYFLPQIKGLPCFNCLNVTTRYGSHRLYSEIEAGVTLYTVRPFQILKLELAVA
jgi:hypothetical protein